jgi:SAM-dependent methyltransferase
MGAYGPLCQQFYDADKPRAGDAEVRWYLDRLPRDAGPVLEPMCGSGRLLLPLVEQGLAVHGVDNSASMLDACRARLAAAGLGATLVRQDVAALNLPFRYAAALIAAGSFQLLTDPTRARASLARIRAHLVPPRVLLVDLFVPEAAVHRPGAPEVEVRAVRDAHGARITLRSESTVDAEARLLSVRSRYERRGRDGGVEREDESLAITWYDEEEIVALLRAAGFVDVAVEPAARGAGARAFAVRATASR